MSAATDDQAAMIVPRAVVEFRGVSGWSAFDSYLYAQQEMQRYATANNVTCEVISSVTLERPASWTTVITANCE